MQSINIKQVSVDTGETSGHILGQQRLFLDPEVSSANWLKCYFTEGPRDPQRKIIYTDETHEDRHIS